jgi:hypothetical protein
MLLLQPFHFSLHILDCLRLLSHKVVQNVALVAIVVCNILVHQDSGSKHISNISIAGQ